MRVRSTVLYLAAAIFLLLLYLYETRKEEKEGAAKEEAKKVFQITPDEIEAISVKKGDGIIRMVRSGVSPAQAWEITEPVRTQADGMALGGVRHRLADLKHSRVVLESTEDVAQFGLDTPGLVIYFRAGQGQGSLSIGNKSPVDNAFFARKDEEKRVLLIAAHDKQELDRTLFDLRDKRLFTLETDNVDRIVLDRKPERWVLAKKDGKWFLEGEEQLKIGREEVETMIRPVLWTLAQSFEKEETQDLAPYGLDRPKARLALSEGTKTEEILLGNEVQADKGGGIYARMAGRSPVVIVRKRILEDLPKDKAQLLEKEKKEEEKK